MTSRVRALGLRVTRRGAGRAVALVAGLTMTVALSLAPGFADEPARVVRSATPILVPARPYWPELTSAQRAALAPLADDWERLDLQTKKKWVEIANRYPKMQPEEQTRTRDRMREWALLTPDQRRVARDSFARVRSMPPEQRAEMLRKYQELPEEKKRALATEGRTTRPLMVPKPLPPTVDAGRTPVRAQLREGAKVRNPALAAQKSRSPVAPPPAVVPAAAAAPIAIPPAAATAATPGSAPATTPPATPASAP